MYMATKSTYNYAEQNKSNLLIIINIAKLQCREKITIICFKLVFFYTYECTYYGQNQVTFILYRAIAFCLIQRQHVYAQNDNNKYKCICI